MHLHQIVFDMSGRIRRYHLTSFDDAKFVFDAAKEFKFPAIWWYRERPEQPWRDVGRSRVTNKQVVEKDSPFRPTDIPVPGDQHTLLVRSVGTPRSNGPSARGTSSEAAGGDTQVEQREQR